MRMAISKVHKAQTFLGVIPRSSTPVIQIVLIDDGAGAQTGTTAGQLAADIMEDIAQHGNAVVLGGSPAGAPKATAVRSSLSPASNPRVQLGFECLQRWRLHNISRQSVLAIDHLCSRTVFSHIEVEFTVFQFVPIASLILSLGSTEKHLAPSSLLDKIPLSLFISRLNNPSALTLSSCQLL